MRIKILGKYWNLKFVNFLGNNRDDGEILGKCEHPESVERTIYVKRGQKPKDELDTILHECVGHATDWVGNSEEYAEAIGSDISTILWKLGYRRLKGKDLKEYDAK